MARRKEWRRAIEVVRLTKYDFSLIKKSLLLCGGDFFCVEVCTFEWGILAERVRKEDAPERRNNVKYYSIGL